MLLAHLIFSPVLGQSDNLQKPLLLPYADFVNGGSVGRHFALGVDYYGLDSEEDSYALGYNAKFGLNESSYLGIGAISFASLTRADYFFADYEFPVLKGNRILISGYFSVFSDRAFETIMYMPGFKARFGSKNSNISMGYNPIFSFEDGFQSETMATFLLNRNAGIHINALHYLNNNRMAFFFNNTLILNQGFKTFRLIPGFIFDFKKIQISPFIMNSITKIEGFNDSKSTEFGFSTYIRV